MPVVGEAWYELSARDEKLVAALKRAEGQATSSGHKIEDAVDGKGATAGMDKSAASVGRFGGMLDKVKAKTGNLGGAISGLAGGVMMGVGMGAFMGVTAAAGALVEGLGSAVQAASDLAETTSKVGVVFGPAADRVLAFGKDAATSMGMSQNAALAAAGTFGNLFVSMGMIPEQSADMSTSLVKLAGDLASFNNVSPEEALEALRSGLVGETEPMRRFGVNINDLAIRQEAMKLGLIATVKDALTPATKAQATYSLVLAQTKTAQGDFARTATGLANQQRIAAARQEDAMAGLGKAILPLVNAVLPALSIAFAGVIEWITGVVTAIGDWLGENKMLTDILGALAGLVGGYLSAVFQTFGNVVGFVFGVIGDFVSAIVPLIKPVVQFVITAIKTVMDIASQIPGPFQEAAKGMSASLAQMQADSEHWGEETTATVDETGKAVVASATTSGENASTGFATGLGSADIEGAAGDAFAPAVSQAKKTRDAVIDEAHKSVQGYASGLRGGYDSVLDAADSLKEALKKPISTTKRIAKLEGILASKDLAKGLRSNDPMIRADAEALKGMVEDELRALKNAAKRFGSSTTREFGIGLNEPGALAKLARQAAIVSRVVKDHLQVRSPAKLGPLSELGGPEGWGLRFGKLYGAGLREGLGNVDLAGMMPTTRFAVSATALKRQDATLTIRVEDRDGGLARAGMSESALADHVRAALDATGLFYSLGHVASMRGS